MKLFGQLEFAQFESLAAAPSTGVVRGRFYYDTTLAVARVYDGAAWQNIGKSSIAPTSTVTGARGAPTAITALGGITPGGYGDEVAYIAGSGGPVTVGSTPQIAAGTSVGQTLELNGCDATNTVLIQDDPTHGVSLNGAWLGGLYSCLGLRWDGAAWCERYRR